MNADELTGRYVILCFRVGEHLEGFVDAYIGPEALKAQALRDGPHPAEGLREESATLLEALPDVDLEGDRALWLEGQLRALECVTARLSGEDISWSQEVERTFGIRPQHVDEEVFRAIHAKLDAVLPGDGDLSTRYNAWTEESQVPPELLTRATDRIVDELRARTQAIAELPDGESVDFETVTDEPWMAFNWYKGGLHSLVQVNLDLPFSLADLVDLVAHEAYPGHHTERAFKEQLLYKDLGRLETSVMIVSAPEAVISEGIATMALETALGAEGYAPVLARLDDFGVELDPDVADVMHVEGWRLFGAATNVARMMHEEGLPQSDAEEYLQEWALHTPERAKKTISFLTDPGSWTYATSYTDGKRLVGAFIDNHPDGFKRLLTEQLTVASLTD